MMWGYPYNYSYAGPFWFVSPFISFLIGLLIVLVIIKVLTRHHRRQEFHDMIDKVKEGKFFQNESALDILKKRYAKGEINKDEFDRISKSL